MSFLIGSLLMVSSAVCFYIPDPQLEPNGFGDVIGFIEYTPYIEPVYPAYPAYPAIQIPDYPLFDPFERSSNDDLLYDDTSYERRPLPPTRESYGHGNHPNAANAATFKRRNSKRNKYSPYYFRRNGHTHFYPPGAVVAG